MSAITSRPTDHLAVPSADSFLAARVHNARRSERPRRPSGVSTHQTQTLDAVPEDSDAMMRRAPPSAFRSGSTSGSDMRKSSHKGKTRDTSSSSMHRSESMDSLAGSGSSGGRQRADWVVDLMEVSNGLNSWSERERVILVIGCPTADSLAPILYNPAFSNTLLLVGSAEPQPSIESLTSPSYLMQTSHRPVYPTLQPFNLPFAPIEGVHTLPALLEEATAIATRFRARTGSSPSKPRSASRRGSADSGVSITPPLTPPMRNNLEPFGRRSSDLSDFARSSTGELAKSPSETSIPSRASRSTRLASMNLSRETIFGGMLKADADVKPWVGGSPIDAVVNFVPPASNFVPQRAMQDMLHQAVVLTTGVLPVLSRRPVKPVAGEVQPPVSLLHVLPSQVPGPLPGVMESFLLSLLPNFTSRTNRRLMANVITSPVWLANPRSIPNNDTHSGSEILLFGGIRCVASKAEDQQQPAKIRAFLPNWAQCTVSAGGSAGSSPSASRRAVPLPRLASDSEPPSIGYASVDARTPPISLDKPLPPTGYPQPHSARRTAYMHSDFVPSTPELDPSGSSCSSTSGIGEPTMGSEEDHGSHGGHGLPSERRKKGLVGWLKSRKGRK